MTELGLGIRRQSATPSSDTNIHRDHSTPALEISKLVDIDLCIGCKACEVACKEWNDLEVEETHLFSGYQSHPDLTANTWDLMRFNEVELADGALAWLIRKDSCLHCEEPGCLLACPAPGAIIQYENGVVDFNQEACIGCQYCVAGCPFDIPRFDTVTRKVYKCTMCVDRIGNGLEPACVKACPTGAIRYGTKADMVAYGQEKVSKLQARGFQNALLYDPAGVGGVHMMYVVPRGEILEQYGLPVDPTVTSPVSFPPVIGTLRKLGTTASWAGFLAAVVYFLKTGRRYPPPEAEAVAEAYAKGERVEGDEPKGESIV